MPINTILMYNVILNNLGKFKLLFVSAIFILVCSIFYYIFDILKNPLNNKKDKTTVIVSLIVLFIYSIIGLIELNLYGMLIITIIYAIASIIALRKSSKSYNLESNRYGK